MNRGKLKSLSILLTFFFCLVLVLCGCSKTKKANDKDEGMVIHVAWPGKLTGFDPMSMRDHSSMETAAHIHESLYQYHFLKRPYVLEPLLAQEMPNISDDRTIYIIKIKKGVYFHDDKCFPDGKGRELKAEDFIYGIKRIANIKNVSQNWSGFDDKIVGLDEFREYTKTCKTREEVDYSRKVEGLYASDDYTLVIKLKRPWPQFIGSALTDTSTAPIAKEAVDYYGKDIINHPIGTGPFMLEEWRRGSYVTLVRNPNYRDERYPSEGEETDVEAGFLDDAGKRLPLADKIEFKIMQEAQPEWLLFLDGKLDAIPVRKDSFQDVIIGRSDLTPKMKQLGIELKIYDEPSLFWVGFNMQDAVLGKNKPLRRAISYGMDRQRFIDIFYSGLGQVAHGIIHPTAVSYNPEIKEYGYSEYNVEKAKTLLIEAEKVHGGKIPPLKIAMAGTNTFYRQFGQFLQKRFNEIGLDVELQFMDWPTYIEKQNKRELQIFTAGASMGMPDSRDMLGMFYSKYWSPGSNRFLYKNEEYDKLFEKIMVMDDSPERRELYRKMELIVLEDCPAAFECHRIIYRIHHDWYGNYKQPAFIHGLGKYRKVDMEKRAAYKELLKKVK